MPCTTSNVSRQTGKGNRRTLLQGLGRRVYAIPAAKWSSAAGNGSITVRGRRVWLRRVLGNVGHTGWRQVRSPRNRCGWPPARLDSSAWQVNKISKSINWCVSRQSRWLCCCGLAGGLPEIVAGCWHARQVEHSFPFHSHSSSVTEYSTPEIYPNHMLSRLRQSAHNFE